LLWFLQLFFFFLQGFWYPLGGSPHIWSMMI
jgi:hypothetical protein